MLISRFLGSSNARNDGRKGGCPDKSECSVRMLGIGNVLSVCVIVGRFLLDHYDSVLIKRFEGKSVNCKIHDFVGMKKKKLEKNSREELVCVLCLST